ncbi:hypothetical protein [Nocardia cerradoensis]|uniref:hypothetical protein n=1 Tax=Nocardia cerradoensis TaxID=85688 RepID=UPI0012F67E46|nr:hypothetical protein [Nocardia cerradoensis]NKY46807.1 hypothetical protein [Nocardia cerradoensis]
MVTIAQCENNSRLPRSVIIDADRLVAHHAGGEVVIPEFAANHIPQVPQIRTQLSRGGEIGAWRERILGLAECAAYVDNFDAVASVPPRRAQPAHFGDAGRHPAPHRSRHHRNPSSSSSRRSLMC